MCKDRYSKFGIETAILREEVDKRLANFILESNDIDLLWDLRKLNGHPKNSAFDPFWQELQKYIARWVCSS